MDAVKSRVVTHTDDAIGQGTQFLVLAAARSPHAFFTPGSTSVNGRRGSTRGSRASRRAHRGVLHGRGAASTVRRPRRRGRRVVAALARDPVRHAAPAPLDAEFDLIKWYAQYRLPSDGADARLRAHAQAGRHRGMAGARHPLRVRVAGDAAEHFEQSHESLALDRPHWTHRIRARAGTRRVRRSSAYAPGPRPERRASGRRHGRPATARGAVHSSCMPVFRTS